MLYRDQLDKSRIPAHIAIIMDGNGRWARSAIRQEPKRFMSSPKKLHVWG